MQPEPPNPLARWGSGWQRLFARASSTESVRALWAWLKRAIDTFSAINGTVWSASFAYYAFFALVPLLLLLVTITTDVEAHLHGEAKAQEMARGYVLANIPLGDEGRHMVGTTLQGVMNSRGKIGVVAVLGLLWSSLGFFQSLVSAINQAWGQDPLNWWKLPLQNMKILGILLSALLLGNILPAILQTIQGFRSLDNALLSPLMSIIGALVPSIVLFYGFLLFYKLAPRRRANVTVSLVWVPALLVTALLQICQRLLTLYTTNITNFNAVYGAFGGVIAMLLWIYLSGTVIVLGGCLCATQRPAPPATLQAADGAPHQGLSRPV